MYLVKGLNKLQTENKVTVEDRIGQCIQMIDVIKRIDVVQKRKSYKQPGG